MSRLNQLLLALKASVENNDSTELKQAIETLHCFPEAERGAVVQLIDALTEMYPLINWSDDLAQIEPQPQWIIEQLPTKHTIKLESGLYRQLQVHFSSRSLKHLSEKEIELLMDELLNELVKEFLKAQEVEYLCLGTSEVE